MSRALVWTFHVRPTLRSWSGKGVVTPRSEVRPDRKGVRSEEVEFLARLWPSPGGLAMPAAARPRVRRTEGTPERADPVAKVRRGRGYVRWRVAQNVI